MDVCVIKRNNTLTAQAESLNICARELTGINNLDAPGFLPRGMALAIPSRREREKQSTELFVCDDCEMNLKDSATFMEQASWISRARRISEQAQENTDAEFCTLAKSFGAVPILTVSNLDEKGFVSPQTAHGLLSEPVGGERFMESLLPELESRGWGGLRLSLEYLFPFDRQTYTDFAGKAAELLHAAGLWLIITVPTAALLQPHGRQGAAYDIAALGEYADRLILVPESMMGAEMLKSCLALLGEKIPLGRLMLDVRTGGELRRGERIESIEAITAHNLAMSAKAEIFRKASGELARFSYKDSSKELCQVRYTDPLWLCKQLDVVTQLGLAGLCCGRTRSLCPAGGAIYHSRFETEKLL